jgi:hypothetical protein
VSELRSGRWQASAAPRRWREEQRSEVGWLADNGACGVHSVELGSESEPSETTMQVVLCTPGRALIIEIEAVSTPGVPYEVVNGTEPIKGASELTVE